MTGVLDRQGGRARSSWAQMATASCAWLSVLVERGVACLKPRTIICCEWTDSFAAVLDKLEDYSEEVVEKVIISTNEKFVDPCPVVPLTAPISVISFDAILSASI